MKQLRCTFSVSNETLSDILIAELSQIGFDGFEVLEDKVLAYILPESFDKEHCEEVLSKYAGLGNATLKNTELLKSVNWNEEWEKNFDPVVIDERLIIRAPFHSTEKEYEHEIVIEPKMAFGTGHHETTFMVLQEMLGMDMAGQDVLDYGCGTGILAVLADQLRAAHIDAIDYDLNAVRNAKEIAESNECKNVNIAQGEKDYFKGKTYDLILANINKNVLKDSISELRDCARDGARLLMSGILRSDSQEMIQLALKFGFKLKSQHEKGQWVLLLFSKG